MGYLIESAECILLVIFLWLEFIFFRQYRKETEEHPEQAISPSLERASKSFLTIFLVLGAFFSIDSLSHSLGWSRQARQIQFIPDYFYYLFYVLTLVVVIPLRLMTGTLRSISRPNPSDQNPTSIARSLLKGFLASLPFVLVTDFILFEGVLTQSIVYLLFGWVHVLGQKLEFLRNHIERIIIIGTGIIITAFVNLDALKKYFQKIIVPQRVQDGKVQWTLGTMGLAVFVFLVLSAGYGVTGASNQITGMMKDPAASNYPPAYHSIVKNDLRNVYLACKVYWADHGGDKSCDRPIFTATTYGYIQSRDVRIDATGGENDFRAVATNVQNGHWFRINELGTIEVYQP